ncbi:MAG: hypothetical protein V2G41_09830 [bacterium JZ-2024 1]
MKKVDYVLPSGINGLGVVGEFVPFDQPVEAREGDLFISFHHPDHWRRFPPPVIRIYRIEGGELKLLREWNFSEPSLNRKIKRWLETIKGELETLGVPIRWD